eukprot:TRINITY_DN113444_c0_g1_i1.p1 TRINITY_DN113444_c0_g1~~TRINITY_DN113444_c0_g1_i1.p1  ORF type:complete len:776 (-),score=213.47 TRINITY_DN113444_c0_g1_i1:356-2683(-)
MYHDPEGPLQTAMVSKAPFLVHYVASSSTIVAAPTAEPAKEKEPPTAETKAAGDGQEPTEAKTEEGSAEKPAEKLAEAEASPPPPKASGPRASTVGIAAPVAKVIAGTGRPPAKLGRIHEVEPLPLRQLYFCDGCSRLVSRRDLQEDVDSYFCPHCLENMPSSEAMLYGMRCSKCWECPVCSCTLSMSSSTGKDASGTATHTYYLACSYCRWSSRGKIEAAQPEPLISKVIALEREGEQKQRMSALVDCFRSKAQEQQREKDLAQRLIRRASTARTSFAATALGSYASRRLSSALMGRRPSSMAGVGMPGGIGDKKSSGAWNMEMLEEKLEQQEEAVTGLRAEARRKVMALAAAQANQPEGGEKSPRGSKADRSKSPTALSPTSERRLSKRPSAMPGGTQATIIPVINGLSVEDLLFAHCNKGEGGFGTQEFSLLGKSQEQIEGANGSAALPLRLQQVSYGYQRLDPSAPVPPNPAGQLRTAVAQFEAPLLHRDAWALCPVRKPLLTKRSRRCRLPPKPGQEVEERSGVGSPADPGGQKCGKIVVKPQINPCSNPPFQKNNFAMAFIPNIKAYAWAPQGAEPVVFGLPNQDEARMAGVTAGQQSDLLVVVANPMESVVSLKVDPMAFNKPADGSEAATKYQELVKDWPLTKEQNVEVLTAPFETEMDVFNDLADIEETVQETEKNKELQAKDDKALIASRKQHKVLLRIAFKRPDEPKEPESLAWVFYVRLGLVFELSGAQHNVDFVVRFASCIAPPFKSETSAEAARRKAAESS